MWTGLFQWVNDRSGAGQAPDAGDRTASTPPPVEHTLPYAPPSQEGLDAAAGLLGALRSKLDERFVELGMLGRGGAGVVLRVFDHNLARQVAMKVVAPTPAPTPGDTDALVTEARVTGQLDHPNILPVHELGVDPEGRAYFIMRMVEGFTLQQRIARHEPLRPREERLQELVLILLKVCDAIAFAHSRGLVHCDLKPSNIMTGSFGEAYVLDWGIAHRLGAPRLDTYGNVAVAGTPAYMPPEQAGAESGVLDERTDVFGLGGLLYAILTGRGPYEVGSAQEALERARAYRLDHPEQVAGGPLPPALCEIAMKALARRPEDRYRSAQEMRQAIERYLRGGFSARVETFAPGATIVREGEPGDAAYFIVRGRCRAVKAVGGERRALREMGPGDVFGEIAVILSQPRTASVEAIDEVAVQVIRRDELMKDLAFHPWLERVVRAITERFRDLDARVHR